MIDWNKASLLDFFCIMDYSRSIIFNILQPCSEPSSTIPHQQISSAWIYSKRETFVLEPMNSCSIIWRSCHATVWWKVHRRVGREVWAIFDFEKKKYNIIKIQWNIFFLSLSHQKRVLDLFFHFFRTVAGAIWVFQMILIIFWYVFRIKNIS